MGKTPGHKVAYSVIWHRDELMEYLGIGAEALPLNRKNRPCGERCAKCAEQAAILAANMLFVPMRCGIHCSTTEVARAIGSRRHTSVIGMVKPWHKWLDQMRLSSRITLRPTLGVARKPLAA